MSTRVSRSDVHPEAGEEIQAGHARQRYGFKLATGSNLPRAEGEYRRYPDPRYRFPKPKHTLHALCTLYLPMQWGESSRARAGYQRPGRPHKQAVFTVLRPDNLHGGFAITFPYGQRPYSSCTQPRQSGRITNIYGDCLEQCERTVHFFTATSKKKAPYNYASAGCKRVTFILPITSPLYPKRRQKSRGSRKYSFLLLRQSHLYKKSQTNTRSVRTSEPHIAPTDAHSKRQKNNKKSTQNRRAPKQKAHPVASNGADFRF